MSARATSTTRSSRPIEAAQAIARQLRLRNLGGIIILDFIDMAREDHQAAVLAELRKQLARDRTRITVSGFSQLGLVEMTRKRTRESLAHMLCEPPTCQGAGQVKTARSVLRHPARDPARGRQFNPKEFRVVAAPAVVEMLLDEEGQHLRACPSSSASRSRCRPTRSDRRSSTTSSSPGIAGRYCRAGWTNEDRFGGRIGRQAGWPALCWPDCGNTPARARRQLRQLAMVMAVAAWSP